MADNSDSPYLSTILPKRRKPVLSFSRRLQINDENEVTTPLLVRNVARKRSDTLAMSPSVLSLQNKKCRLSSSPALINSPTVDQSQNQPQPQQLQISQPSEHSPPKEKTDQSPSKRQESEALIMKAVQLSDKDPDLIGDFTKPYSLPVCSGKHSDLKTITAETLAALLRGQYKNIIDSHTIIDGRYPYEYEGGHIMGAKNIYNKMALFREFLDNQQMEEINVDPTNPEKVVKKHRHILIFHCEFSSERGPSLSRFLRNKDREINTCRYPQLYHPEIYILHGGYKAFYEKFKSLCTPQSYIPMVSKDFKDQMKQFRAESKNLNKEATTMITSSSS